MECLGRQYIAEVVIVPWQSPIATFLAWIMLNAGYDNNSDAAVSLSTGMLGMVEVITVYFQIIFEVSLRFEHYVDLLLF